MKFHYTASQPDGKILEGDLEASGYEEVLQYLASKGLRPVSVKVLKNVEISKAGFFGQVISIADKIFISRYLSLMLKAGTDLFRAISILINDLDKPILKAFLIEIRANLEKGNPFYTVFARYPQYFSDVFVNLVKAGEASGNLVEVLNGLSISLGREQELRNKIRAALIYPVILMVMSFLILILLVTFAIPKIANVFLSAGSKPPFFSQLVFNTGLFLNSNAIIVFPLIAFSAVAFWYFIAKTYSGKRFLYIIGARAPVIKNVIKQYALQRFANTFSSLLKSGIPIMNALEITADAVGSFEIQESLHRVAREGIAKGLTIGDAFRKEAVFPQVVINLIAISEKAGHIEEILKTLADFYESEVDAAVKTLVAFIEPLLLLFIGVLIGGIALAIIVPIYQLVGTI